MQEDRANPAGVVESPPFGIQGCPLTGQLFVRQDEASDTGQQQKHEDRDGIQSGHYARPVSATMLG